MFTNVDLMHVKSPYESKIALFLSLKDKVAPLKLKCLNIKFPRHIRLGKKIVCTFKSTASLEKSLTSVPSPSPRK